MSTNTVIPGCGHHHTAMKVAPFNETVAFYRDTLGFAVRHAWGEGNGQAVMLDMGDGSCLEIFAGGPEPRDDAEPNPMVHVCLQCDDVDAAVAICRAAGRPIQIEPKDVDVPAMPTPLKARLAFVGGPAGEVIEFFCPKG